MGAQFCLNALPGIGGFLTKVLVLVVNKEGKVLMPFRALGGF